MRQQLSIEDEPHLSIRSLSVNYGHSGSEPAHTHTWPQFLYALSGALRVDVNNEIWTIPPRRGLWIPARLPHQLRMMGEVRLRTLYWSPSLASPFLQTTAIDVCGLLHELILRVCDLQWLDARVESNNRMAAIILDELRSAGSTAIRLPLPDDYRARRLIALFLDEDSAGVHLNELLSLAGLSRRTAERIFKSETGLSPARWRRSALISRAFEYLAEGMPVENVATLSGFQSRSAFSEAFKATFGFRPAAARGE